MASAMTTTPHSKHAHDDRGHHDHGPAVTHDRGVRIELDPAFIARLLSALPKGCLLTDPEETVTYESDGLFHLHEKPLAVVLPETEAQVAAVLRACRDFKVPIVPRGAGTGLAGGALPHAQGILMSLTKIKALVEVDVAARQARVQPGHTNLAISNKVAHHGLFYAPDPSSQLASSIGGNVAENSGGVHCLKYGLTVHNVLGLRIVTSDGDAIAIGEGSLDQPGYDDCRSSTGPRDCSRSLPQCASSCCRYRRQFASCSRSSRRPRMPAMRWARSSAAASSRRVSR